MSTIESHGESQPHQPVTGARVLASWLLYGQATLSVVSILIHWQMTGRLNLDLTFLFLIWCGYAISRGSRAAVNWGLIIAGYAVFVGGLVMYFAWYDPTELHSSDDALTPSRIRMAFVAGIESTLWGLIAWNQIRVVSRREEITFTYWFDPWMLLKVSVLLGLIVAMIVGLFWLESPDIPPLADEVPITNSQAEQIEILKQRYARQIEFLKKITLNPALRNDDDYWQQRKKLFDEDPAIIDGSFESVIDDGVSSMTESIRNHYRELSFKTVPAYYPKGSVTLKSGKRYSVIEYSDFVRNDDGVWLEYDLTVRQDHLQESEPDFE